MEKRKSSSKKFAVLLSILLTVTFLIVAGITVVYFLTAKKVNGSINFGVIEMDTENVTSKQSYEVVRNIGIYDNGNKVRAGDTVNFDLSIKLSSNSEPTFYLINVTIDNEFSDISTNEFYYLDNNGKLLSVSSTATEEDKICGQITIQDNLQFTFPIKISENLIGQDITGNVTFTVSVIQQSDLTIKEAYDLLIENDNIYPSANITQEAIQLFSNANEIGFYKTNRIPQGYTYDATKTASARAQLDSASQELISVYSNTDNKVAFVCDGKIQAPVDSTLLFSGLSNLQTLNLNNFATDNVTSMARMFQNCSNLENIYNLNSLKTSKVTNMQHVFNGCNNISKLTISNWVTSSVENFTAMFQNCWELTSVNLSNWNTKKATTMAGMFNSCYILANLDVSNFDTSNVTNFQGTFQNCKKITSFNLSNWNTQKATTMQLMFNGCSGLISVDLSGFDVSKVTSFVAMFQNCNELTSLNTTNWHTSNALTNMSFMFNKCYKLTSFDVSGFDVSKVTSFQATFQNCKELTNLDVSNWNTSNALTNIEWMFYNCEKLESSLDFSNCNFSNVSSSNYTFSYCKKIPSIILPNDITIIGECMFENCDGLTEINLNENANITIGALAFFNTEFSGDFHISKNWTFNEGSNGPFLGSEIERFILDADDTRYMSYNNDGHVYKRKSSDPNSSDYNIPVRLEFVAGGNLKTYTLPSSVTSIRRFELPDVMSLEYIEVENGNENFKAINGILYEISNEGLIISLIPNKYTNKDVVLGEEGELYSIQACGAYDMETLTVVNASNITVFGGCALQACENLKRINSDTDGVFDFTQFTSLDYLAYKCFEYCHYLTTLKLSTSIKTLGDGFAHKAENLTDVYIYNTTEVVNIVLGTYTNSYAENFINENITIHVPASMLSSYLADSNWATLSSHLIGDINA